MQTTIQSIKGKKGKEKIVALTAYDSLTARLLDEAGIDIVLVGDSLGMVLLGYDTTLPVTMEDMIHHTKAASRAVKKALLVADMPFGSYDTAELAVKNAKRFIDEAGAAAVKLEGGRKIEKQVRALLTAKIPVMGHIGMTPQSVEELGGYKVQGKSREDADQIVKDAELLNKLGVFSIVLECIPAELGAEVTKRSVCPTIGIGAGPDTDGQILVLYDMLGFSGKVSPKFVRRYADLESSVKTALTGYRKDVLAGKFPSKKESY